MLPLKKPILTTPIQTLRLPYATYVLGACAAFPHWNVRSPTAGTVSFVH